MSRLIISKLEGISEEKYFTMSWKESFVKTNSTRLRKKRRSFFLRKNSVKNKKKTPDDFVPLLLLSMFGVRPIVKEFVNGAFSFPLFTIRSQEEKRGGWRKKNFLSTFPSSFFSQNKINKFLFFLVQHWRRLLTVSSFFLSFFPSSVPSFGSAIFALNSKRTKLGLNLF